MDVSGEPAEHGTSTLTTTYRVLLIWHAGPEDSCQSDRDTPAQVSNAGNGKPIVYTWSIEGKEDIAETSYNGVCRGNENHDVDNGSSSTADKYTSRRTSGEDMGEIPERRTKPVLKGTYIVPRFTKLLIPPKLFLSQTTSAKSQTSTSHPALPRVLLDPRHALQHLSRLLPAALLMPTQRFPRASGTSTG